MALPLLRKRYTHLESTNYNMTCHDGCELIPVTPLGEIVFVTVTWFHLQ